MKNNKYEEHQEIVFASFCLRSIRESAAEMYESIKAEKENGNEIPYCQALDIASSQHDPAARVEENYVYLLSKGDRYYIRNEKLANALLFLPPKQREAIVLSFLEGKTDYRIAQEVHVCPGTIAYRKQSGLAMLRRIMGE